MLLLLLLLSNALPFIKIKFIVNWTSQAIIPLLNTIKFESIMFKKFKLDNIKHIQLLKMRLYHPPVIRVTTFLDNECYHLKVMWGARTVIGTYNYLPWLFNPFFTRMNFSPSGSTTIILLGSLVEVLTLLFLIN